MQRSLDIVGMCFEFPFVYQYVMHQYVIKMMQASIMQFTGG